MTGRKYTPKIVALLLSMFVIIGTSVTAYAADTEVLIQMDNQNLRMGVSTQLSLVLRNMSSKASLDEFKGLEHFEVLSTSQSSSTSIINGTSTKEVTLTYTVLPKEEGSFDLRATVSSGGNTFTTNTLTVNVTPADASLDENSPEVFMKTTLSKDQVYFGDELVVTYELYSRYQVEDFGFTDTLGMDGFIVEQSGDGDYTPSYLDIGDNRYVMYTVKQLVLTPTGIGTFTLPSYQFQVNLSTGGFFGSSKATYLTSEAKEFEVIPLPTAGQPLGFNGLIGDYGVEANYSAHEVSENEPVTLKVTLEGTGNLSTISGLSEWMDLSNFSVYETAEENESSILSDGRHFKKDFELILVPKQSGNMEIAETSIPYFNTTTGQYDEIIIPGQAINVNGSEVTSSTEDLKETGSYESPQVIPMVISQVSYNQGSSTDGWVLHIKKEHMLIGLSSLIFILLTLTIGFSVLGNKARNRATSRRFKKQISQLKDRQQFLGFLDDYFKKNYQKSLHAYAIDDLVALFGDGGKKSAIKDLLLRLENPNPLSQEEVQEVRKTILSYLGTEEKFSIIS